jgi:hypothetical protein
LIPVSLPGHDAGRMVREFAIQRYSGENMLKQIARLAGLTALALIAASAQAQDERVYTEGPVVNVSSIRTEAGKFDAYMAYLAGTYRKIMEEAKAQGLVLEYAFYQAQPRAPDDPDLYLVTVYPNYAALDGLDAKLTAIQTKIWGSQSALEQAEANRENIRKVLGTELIQELKLK